MAKTTTFEFQLDASPDQVVAVLSSPEFEIEQQTSQAGTKSVTVEQISRDERKLVFVLHAIEYARGVKGIDHSKTEKADTRVEWDLVARRSNWTYSGSHGAMVKVWGGTEVKPSGSGSVVRCTFNVDVKIPLIGGKIESIVLKESDKFWPSFERIARAHCAR